MSYSFGFEASTKGEAGDKIAAELKNVVNAQPSHAADQQAALDAAVAFIKVLRDPGEGETIHIRMSGSLSWQTADVFTGASVNISAYVAPKA